MQKQLKCDLCGKVRRFEDQLYTVCFSCDRKLSYNTQQPLTQRRCRKCTKWLPASRYYNCLECVPVLEEDIEFYQYYG